MVDLELKQQERTNERMNMNTQDTASCVEKKVYTSNVYVYYTQHNWNLTCCVDTCIYFK